MLYRTLAFVAILCGAVSAVDCNAGQFISFDGATSTYICNDCPVGSYNPTPVSGTTVTQCTPCDAGYFVDVTAAKQCCPCCEGFYAESTGSSSCDQCPSGLGGPAASTDSINCTPDPSVATCTMNGNQCPMVSPGGPQGTTVTKKRSNKCFRKGYKRCPKLYGTGGTECVDVANDTDSCGGCMALASDVPSSLSNVNGVDCNTLPGINVAKCVRGQCKAESCQKGYTVSDDGNSCEKNSTLQVQARRRR